MIYVEAPHFTKSFKPSIFLAGGITNCPPWQDYLIELIKGLNIIIFNPRRKIFPIDKAEEAPIQIKWECDMLDRATIVSFWFCKETDCPITLLELGTMINSKKPIIVGMDPDYPRRRDIEIRLKLKRPELVIVYSLVELSHQIIESYSSLYPILKDNTIGIYCIKNKLNGKVYIGQSRDIKSRWSHHKSLKSPHEHLKSAFLKYGLINFKFFVLKEISNDEDTQKNLDYFEQYYIDTYNSMDKNFGYNKKEGGSRGRPSKESVEKSRRAKIGKSINKGVPKSPLARIHMSLAHPDYIGDKNPMYGKKHSIETRKKMSNKAKTRTGSKNPFFGKHISEEHKKKLTQKSKEKTGIKIYCHDNDTIYDSIHDAAKNLNICTNSVVKICKGLKVRKINIKLSFYKVN